MTKSELRQMISRIVEDEIRKLAPVIVEEFLTEKYLGMIVEKKMSRGRRPSSLDELMANDTDDDQENRIPEPPEADHDGVYNGKVRMNQPEGVVNKLLSPENPWSGLFEGVRPIGGSQPTSSPAPVASPGISEQQFGPSGVPIDKLPGFSDRMRQIMGATNKRDSSHSAIPQSASAEERRLAEHRARLDQRVVNTPKVV
jgi:hypothetical protein